MTTPICYQYDAETGAYTGQTPASASPLEPGKFLLPRNATLIAPPTVENDRSVAVFKDGAWSILSDWRGVDLYSTETLQKIDQIKEIGQVPADFDATHIEPPGPEYIWTGEKWIKNAVKEAALQAAALEARWQQIKARRDAGKNGGIKVGEHWFHSDADSRIQHIGLKDAARDLVANGGSLDDVLTIAGQPVMWKTMSGEFVPITGSLTFWIVANAATLDAFLFAAAEQHRAAMMASGDPEYDFSGGWPEAYEG
jgi:hypothetical protein